MDKMNCNNGRIKARNSNKGICNDIKSLMKYALLTFLLLCAHFAKAQLSPVDSLFFNQNFTDPAYSYDTSHPNIFQMQPVISQEDLTQRLDSLFPFTEANFWGSYKRLEIAQAFYYDTALNNEYNWYFTTLGYGLGQTDPVINLNYSLDGYTRSTSALYTPGTNTASSCETAFFIFPGSGPNCTYQVATATGYHSLFCNTKSTLKQYGDVFTYCKPNEDWRAILWEDKKLATEGGSAYLLNYLDGNNHHLSINANIEFLAFLKLLKSKYKKVVVLALSHGGLNTVMSLSEVSVDGYLISGGYTAATYLVQSQVFQQQKYFGNTYNLHPPAVIKNNIMHANSEFLFAWSQADGQMENPDHYTENYFGPLPNVSYNYNFPQHSFPYCPVIDSFVQRVQSKPKPFIKPLNTNCTTDSLTAQITFCGQPPFSFDLYKDEALYDSYISNTDTFDIVLSQEGGYSIANLFDASNTPGYRSDTLLYKKDSMVDFNVTSRYFSCDSNDTKLQIHLDGTSPWIVNYDYNGFLHYDTIYTNTKLYSLQNGNITFLNVTDSNTCYKALTQTYDIADSLVDINTLSPEYSCDSNKTRIHLMLEGRAPWKINYKKNGVAGQFTLHSNDTNLYFENALYEFIDVIDSNLCSKTIDQVFTFNESATSCNFLSRNFDCSTGMTQLNFHLSGKAPWVIYYAKNGINDSATFQTNSATITVDNGEYHFYDVRDSNNCTRIINEDFSVQDSLPQFQITGNGFLCLLQQTQVNYTLSGRAPWTLSYLMGSTLESVTTNNIDNSLYLLNGTYTFLSVTDSNGCSYPINETLTIDENLPTLVSTQVQFDCAKDSFLLKVQMLGESPYMLYYTRNGAADSFVFENMYDSVYIPRGNYYLNSIVDSNNCSYFVDTNLVLTDSLPELTIVASGFSCSKNSNYIALTLAGKPNWQILYKLDNISYSFSTDLEADTLWVDNGTVEFQQLIDSNGCSLPLSEVLIFKNHLPRARLLTVGYDCARQQGYCSFGYSGNLPISLSYDVNGQSQTTLLGVGSIDTLGTDTLWLDNGVYEFNQVTDTNGCSFIIDSTVNINYAPLTFDYEVTEYNCINNLGRITLKILTGNAPYQINVTNNGVADALTTTTGLINYQFVPGSFQIHTVRDVEGCTVYPDVDLNISNDSLEDPRSIYLEGLKVKTDNSGIKYIWYYNNKIYDTTETPIADFIGNGMYHVGIINSNGCIYYTRSVLLNKGKFVVFPNPAKEEVNILIGLPADVTANVDLFDAIGRHIKTISVRNGINVMSLKDLVNGVYIFKVKYKEIGYFFEDVRVIKR